MTALVTYPWFDQVPEHLKTRKQLAEQGLRPGGPVVARVVWRRGKRWADLYDLNTAKPKRAMSEAQRAALDKAHQAQRTCPGCGHVYKYVLGPSWRPRRDCGVCEAQARQAAVRQAKIWLRSHRTVILDTETTDLDGYLVQLAIIDTAGNVLFDSLINPQAEVSVGARQVHGITDEQLSTAPTFSAIADDVTALLRGRRVVTYNASFDRGIFQNEIARLARQEAEAGGLLGMEAHSFGLQAVRTWCKAIRWRCAMELWSQFVGDWSEYHQSYRWQPLPGGDHSALGDARACLAVLRTIANDTSANI